MFQNDFVGIAFVYIYVILLLIFTEKILSKKYPMTSRKILHIMTGNIAFILPIFQTREMMVFLAAGPFILFTFLMSPYSPGLVYYAIAWAVLAYLFFDTKEVIAIGILAMSYGDGLASLIGIKFGKKKYQIFEDVKSYIGSYAMFTFTFIMMIVALLFYGKLSLTYESLFLLLCIAGISTIAESMTPKGLDNLSVPFVAAILYFILMVM
jgi:dolichol kinase